MKREDRIAILDWADSTGADSPTKEKIKGILDDIDALDVLQSVDVDKALERTRKKIRRQGNGRLVWFSLAGAAISAAACTAVFLFLGIFGGTGTGPVYSELKVNPGMTGTFILPDSSVVVLNGGSVLSYNGSFNDKTREVTLDGEAYFDVARNEELPFTVKTCKMDVTALGTKFNVKAYEEEGEITATLIEGSIRTDIGEKSEVLKPNQYLILDKETGKTTKITADNPDHLVPWRNNEILFAGENLAEIASVLERMYNLC